MELKIIDQHGEPLANAVVVIPEGKIDQIPLQSAVMDQQNKRFKPYVLAIEKGRNVVFPNSDSIRHHVYSFSKAKTFEIKLYRGVPERPLSFDQEGLVVLGCNIHDSMVGYIYVSQWPHFDVSNAEGKATLPVSHDEILVWHPRLAKIDEPVPMGIDANSGSITIELDVLPPPKPSFRKKFERYMDDER